MRALTPIISLIFLAFGLGAQGTISIDWAPKVGDAPWALVVLNEVPEPGDGGADVTWDFTDLNEDAITWIVTFDWIDPEDTPYADSFPDATICGDFGLGGFTSYGYYGESGNDFSYYGGANDFGFDIYIDPQSFVNIDLPYGQTAVDTYEVAYITDFSDPDTVTGFTSYTYDGYGTVMIGDLVLEDAIRIYQVSVEYDSSEFFGLTDVFIDSTVTYAWIGEGALFPVVQWQRSRTIGRTYFNGTLLDESDEGDTVFGYWRDYMGTSGLAEFASLPELTVSPTVTKDYLNVQYAEPGNPDYRIFTVTGKLVDSGVLNSQSATISLDRMQSGIYVLSVDGYQPVRFVKQE